VKIQGLKEKELGTVCEVTRSEKKRSWGLYLKIKGQKEKEVGTVCEDTRSERKEDGDCM